jgi:hypothetical protein
MRHLYVLYAVMLPAGTLGAEVGLALCAEALFDPIPTPWHMGLVGLVVLTNALVLLADTPRGSRWRGTLARLNGVAAGIALVYAVVFLPLMPLALIAVLFVVGWFALAPALAFAGTLVARSWLKNGAAGGKALPRLWPWMAFGASLLVVIEVPGALTRAGVRRASSSSPEESARAVGWLREYAPRGELLRLCYSQGSRLNLTGLVLGAPVSTEEARAVLFRVTGRPVSSFAPPPRLARFPWADVRDPDQGGAEVGFRVAGLTLAASRIEGTQDAAAGLADLEWTLRFHNAGPNQAEARGEVELPSGAVVSRLTLWIDGKPREATFAPTQQVRAAYESVVRQRRDPVLVTASGPGRVLVQCFPVPANGGEMQVRLGVTAPLEQNEPGKPELRLPRFAERNFDIPEGVRHEVRIDGQGLVAAAGELRPRGEPGKHVVLGGAVRDEALSSAVGVRLSGPAMPGRVWALGAVPGETVVQELRAEKAEPARRIVVVLDGSATMPDALAEAAAALSLVPTGADVRVLVAGDRVIDFTDERDLFHRLSTMRAAGGCDNVPALLRAWDLAAEVTPSAVVWVHGAQPVVLSDPKELHERFDQWPEGLRFYDAAIAPGPNRILSGRGSDPVVPLPRRGTLNEDLARLRRALTTASTQTRVSRRILTGEEAAGPPERQVTPQIGRLWAYNEVLRLCRSGGERNRGRAAQLSAERRLVTPVCGAVVLETKEQYDRAGLKPADDLTEAYESPGAAGVMRHGPEPGWLLLLGLVAGVLGCERWKRRPAR